MVLADLRRLRGPVAAGVPCSSPGPFEIDSSGRIRGRLENSDFPEADSCMDRIGQPVNNIASLAAAMKAGLIYLNLHTDAVPSGEVRGQMAEESTCH